VYTSLEQLGVRALGLPTSARVQAKVPEESIHMRARKVKHKRMPPAPISVDPTVLLCYTAIRETSQVSQTCEAWIREELLRENEQNPDVRQRRSRGARLLLATVALLTLLPCLGLLVSAGYVRLRQVGAFSRWRALGAPPGGGVDILTGDLEVVYVRALGGTLYSCAYEEKPSAAGCWQPAPEPLRVDEWATFDRRVLDRDVRPPAGTVTDTLEVSAWYPEHAFEARFALLDNGTLWVWRYDVGSYLDLFILIVGLGIGTVLGMVAVAVLWVRR